MFDIFDGLLLMLCLCCSLLRPCACGIGGLTRSSRNGRCVMLKKGIAVHGKASSGSSDAKKLRQRRKQIETHVCYKKERSSDSIWRLVKLRNSGARRPVRQTGR